MYLDKINKYYCAKMKVEIQDLIEEKSKQISFNKEVIGKKIKDVVEYGGGVIYIFFADGAYSIISAENNEYYDNYLCTFQNIWESSNIEKTLNILIKNNIMSITDIDIIIKKYEEYEKKQLKVLKEKYERS